MAQEEQKPAETAAPPAAAAAAPAKAPSPWPPLIAVIVLMPVLSYATTQYLILPKIRGTGPEKGEHGTGKPGAQDAHGKPAAHHAGKEAASGHEAAGKFTYDFENVVVNLSGSLGTKYLKTSFTLFSSSENLKKLVEENKKQLMDVAINVLSSRSMADLEAAGAKNVVRNDLMANFNQALHSDLVEQIYYTEFVVQ